MRKQPDTTIYEVCRVITWFERSPSWGCGHHPPACSRRRSMLTEKISIIFSPCWHERKVVRIGLLQMGGAPPAIPPKKTMKHNQIIGTTRQQQTGAGLKQSPMANLRGGRPRLQCCPRCCRAGHGTSGSHGTASPTNGSSAIVANKSCHTRSSHCCALPLSPAHQHPRTAHRGHQWRQQRQLQHLWPSHRTQPTQPCQIRARTYSIV